MIGRRAVLTGAMALAASAKAAAPRSRLYRQVPSTSERIPIVGLGTYIAFDIDRSDPDWAEAGRALALFLGEGGRVIDSSPMYGKAEEAIGTLLAGLPQRGRAFLATKVWTADADEGGEQVERSFRRLRTRRIDLLQVHNLLGYSAHMPRLQRLKEEGRVRYLGATHYHSGAYDALERVMLGGGLDCIQINYSVAEREAERRILPLARDKGIAVLVNRPFAAGGVFGRVQAKPLPPWAGELGCTSWAQLLLKFVLADSAVTCAIPGTRNPRHVIDNLGAALPPLPSPAMRRRILEAVLG